MAVRATPSSFRSENRRAGYPRYIGTEIERKFLLDEPAGGLSGPPGVQVRQGYLAIAGETEVRLRQAGVKLTLTLKNGHGESRRESEVQISREAFEGLWPETGTRRVEKFRRQIDLGNDLVAEVDQYQGDLDGIAVVEVEFGSEVEAASFWPPTWFGRELTGDKAWANQTLALVGVPDRKLEFRLRPLEDPAAGVCRVVTARASEAAAAVRAAGEGDQAAQVHQARKSLKKARSGIRLLRGILDEDDLERANETCREAARRLSKARDAEVKMATLKALAERDEPVEAGEGFAAWSRQLLAEADTHRDDLNPETLAEIAKQIDSVARSFRGLEPPSETRRIAANLARSYERGHEASKQARNHKDPEDFHRWRKRAKDLWYQLDMLEPRLPKKFRKTRRSAKDLAQLLGDIHDLDVLAEDLSARDIGEGTAAQAKVIAEARKALAKAGITAGREVYRQKPGKLRARVSKALSDEA